MRIVILLALLALGACADDQFSSADEPTGPWVPANADMGNTDNNLVPLPAQGRGDELPPGRGFPLPPGRPWPLAPSARLPAPARLGAPSGAPAGAAR